MSIFYKLLFYNISSHTFNSKWIRLLNEKILKHALEDVMFNNGVVLPFMKSLIIFSRDLGANLLGKALSGLLDGLLHVEVL